MTAEKYILTQEAATHKLQRLALEIAEQLEGDDTELIIIGIQKSGVVIAEKIAALVKEHVSFAIKNITATFDKEMPATIALSENVDFNEKNILICDDVANSGKTLSYVLKPLLDFYPKRIQTLVLVERMHKLFPVKPDYVGLSIATTLQDHIQVQVKDGEILGAIIK